LPLEHLLAVEMEPAEGFVQGALLGEREDAGKCRAAREDRHTCPFRLAGTGAAEGLGALWGVANAWTENAALTA